MNSLLAIIFAAVIPAYTTQNRAPGSTPVMTNLTAWAADVDSRSSGGGASTNVVNDLIVSYDQTNLSARIAAATKVESVNGKTGVVTIVSADIGSIAWSAVTNTSGGIVTASDIPALVAGGDSVKDQLDSAISIAGQAARDIGMHEADHANPHQVTAGQVGALPSDGGTLNGALTINASLTVGGIAHLGDILHNESEVVYGISTNGTDYLHANVNLAPFASGILSQAEAGSASIATNAAKAVVEPVSNVVFNAETYFAIDKDNLSLVSYTTNIWQSVYELTNFTDATSINVYSGQIVRDQLSAANTNLSVTLKFPAGAQSAGDAILRMVCATNSVIGIVAVDGASAYELKGADKWNELNPGDSLVTFTKTAVTNGVWEIWCSKAESGL